ncbi:MAG: HAD family hydrolase, partial [Spirochaetia bacterium]|nr:HAD family hydrolase [Spirochaetia bacterium]
MVPGNIKHFLLDLDGTLYLGDRLFEATPRLLEKIKSTGRKKLFLTNNSSKSVNAYIEKLKRQGLSASRDDVLTSGSATISYLRKETKTNKIFLMGTPSLELEFLQAGFELVEDERPDCVVLGFDR